MKGIQIICVYIYLCMYVYMCVSLWVCVYLCLYSHVYVCYMYSCVISIYTFFWEALLLTLQDIDSKLHIPTSKSMVTNKDFFHISPFWILIKYHISPSEKLSLFIGMELMWWKSVGRWKQISGLRISPN